MSLVTVPAPIVPLELGQLLQLQREHLARGSILLTYEGSEWVLNGDCEALVSALLELAIEALTIHALAEAMPHRPVAEVLTQAVHQLRRS